MTLEKEKSTSSVTTWRDEMNSQLERGKHILLYGNVDDRCLLDENRPRTVLLAQALNHYFLTRKYQLVVHYDLADGMRTAIPESMDSLLLSLLDGQDAQNSDSCVSIANPSEASVPPKNSARISSSSPEAHVGGSFASVQAEKTAAEFELASRKRRDAARSSIFTRRSGNNQQADENSGSGNSSSASSASSSGRQSSDGFFQGIRIPSFPPGTAPETSGQEERPVDDRLRLSVRSKSAEDVIPQLRRVLAQDRISTAVIIHFSDKLFDDTRRQGRSEREYLLHLKKILTEAATIRQGNLAGRRNALILVASRLASVPTWLYQEHPLLALIRIPSPLDEERRKFIEGFLSVFTRDAAMEGDLRQEYVQTFVEQTQGLALWDLMALGALANRSSEDPIDEPAEIRKLISLYRYGQKEDPWENFNSGDRRNRIQDARESIEMRVKGQPEAVEAIVEMLISATVGISMSPVTRQSGKPKGVFFFVGPTGVGKTELAKALAELIFGDESRLRRFDMSEFSEAHAAEKLTGSPPGYVGYEEGGQLTNFVRENPFSLLLFDEIEKAHGQVMDKFLQILEDGRLTDSKGQTAFFSQSVIIFTSNIGADTLFSEDGTMGNEPVSDDFPSYENFIKKHFLEKVREHFVRELKRPEILNRFGDNVIVFDILRPGFVRAIGEKFLSLLKISARERRGLILEFEPSVLEYVQKQMTLPENIKNGGRRIRTLLEDRLEKKLNRWIFEHQPASGTVLILGLNEYGDLNVQEP
ncbi:MAG: ATP-dependent Clp protease ATP-binding subunit [Thermoguttaceae bacterium]|nr:ATP-dependent Clp protease ATP-binding subunit [Thermoguttaceae bacterium]